MIINKALSVHMPYAEYIASGKKTIEIRSWRTSFRGDILICCSQNRKHYFPLFNNISINNGKYHSIINYPFGYSMAVVELVDCKKMVENDAKNAFIEYRKGYYSWYLENIRRVKPIRVIGQQSIFNVDLDVELE